MVTLDQAGAGTASLRIVAPSGELRSRVQHLWVERPVEAGRDAPRAWRIVADHCAHLLYHRRLAQDGVGVMNQLLLVGPRSVAVDIDKRGRLVTAGVRLQPWALPALFGLSAAELANRSVALADVPGSEAGALAARLAATSPEDLPSVLERWLRLRAGRVESRAERRARAAARLLHTAAMGCDATASELGISSRSLRSLMYEQIGLAPKTFARIGRLHVALTRGCIEGREASWSRIAAAAGFSDQAHLIREFRHLLGETPVTWAKRSVNPTGL